MIGKLVKRSFFSTSARENGSPYIDKWFESIIKPASFYEEQTCENTRRYFYNVDMNGRLFLEETTPKNIASSIKDEKFLNFFFSRIRWAQQKEIDPLLQSGYSDHYPFVSLCGREVNYIRPACSPIVYHSILNKCDGDNLVYGGSLTQPFDNSRLAISTKTGRLYHELASPMKGSKGKHDYGLLRSSVTVSLAERIIPGETHDEPWSFLSAEGNASQIGWLPAYAEPGKWAMQDETLQW